MASKKVLIITYYWPPAGGISVLRCLKFAKYLREFGWEPIVYVPENADYPSYDDTNSKDIPEGITILKYPIWEPFSLFKKLSGRKKSDNANPVYQRDKKPSLIDKFSIWLRGNYFIPDARAAWIKPSVKYLSEYLSNNPVDALLTDGPPHTNTVIACQLSKKFSIPWLADFQDPWTQVDYYKMMHIGRRADGIHKRLEQEAFRTAKKITIASPTWKKDLESIGANNVDVIYWGYDEDDFAPITPQKNTDHFVILHAGILGFDRLPDKFIKAVGDLAKANSQFRKKLLLKFYGPVDFELKELVQKEGLEQNTLFGGNISRQKVLEELMNANLLLLLLNKADNAQGRLPGKLYEYLRAYTPILCLGPEHSDASHILKETQTGDSLEYNDYEGIFKTITRAFEHKSMDFKPQNIQQFDIKNQTEKVAGYLNEISS